MADFLLWIDSTGRVLPIRTGTPAASLAAGSTACVVLNLKSPEGPGSVTALTTDFQKFSPFAPTLEEGADKRAGEESTFLSAHMRPPAAGGGSQRVGPNGTAPLDYNPYYTTSDYYSTLAKEHSLESQDSSTLSSPSDCLTQRDPLFQARLPRKTPCSSSPLEKSWRMRKLLRQEQTRGRTVRSLHFTKCFVPRGWWEWCCGRLSTAASQPRQPWSWPDHRRAGEEVSPSLIIQSNIYLCHLGLKVLLIILNHSFFLSLHAGLLCL